MAFLHSCDLYTTETKLKACSLNIIVLHVVENCYVDKVLDFNLVVNLTIMIFFFFLLENIATLKSPQKIY